MEPIPETRRAVEEYGPFGADDLLEELHARAVEVRGVVPDCVGLSLAVVQHGITFTLVATDAEIAALDAVQYLDDGPCVRAADADSVEVYSAEDPLAEGEWQAFADATAARGIGSTLTLPILHDGAAIGSINLYAVGPRSFDGHHHTLASIFGAWAPGAVVNADLDFSTRTTAEQAPQQLRDQIDIARATGVLVSLFDIDIPEAQQRLGEAARRADVDPAVLARVLLHLRDPNTQT